MARQARLVVPGAPHHLIHRGNNRCAIFRERPDYRYFLTCWWDACAAANCDVHAYVLMTNHVHFLLTPHGADGLERLTRSAAGRYAKYFNAKYSRTGTIWEGRPRTSVVDSEAYFLVCSRYIELNPVRASLVRTPAAYPWSSFRHNALGELEPQLRNHSVYQALGRTVTERTSAYLELFEGRLDPATLQAIRAAANGGWALGGKEFREHMEEATLRQCSPGPKGGARQGAGRPRNSVVSVPTENSVTGW
jgi:putative transposase